MGQAHAEDGVTGLQKGEVDGAVGLRASMRLDVGVVGAEQFLGAVDGQLLDHVDVLATAVVALARIAFGVLVGEHRTLGFHHRRAGVVLRGDQLDVVFLTLGFLLHGSEEIGVETGEGQITAEHGSPLRSAGGIKEKRGFYLIRPVAGMSDSHAQDEQPPLPQPRRRTVAVCPDRCIRVALRPFHATPFSAPHGLGQASFTTVTGIRFHGSIRLHHAPAEQGRSAEA